MARRAKVRRARQGTSSAKKRGFSLAALATRTRKRWKARRNHPLWSRGSTRLRRRPAALKKQSPTASKKGLSANSRTEASQKIALPNLRARLIWVPVLTGVMLIMAPPIPRDHKPAPTIAVEVAAAAFPRLSPPALPHGAGLTELDDVSPPAVTPQPAPGATEDPPATVATHHRRTDRPSASWRRHRKRYATRRHSKETTKRQAPPCPS
jgi:hypothetical protein